MDLRKEYYNPKSGFVSAKKLYEKVKHLGYKMKDVQAFIKSQEVNQRFVPPKKEKFVPLYANDDYERWQADLVDMRNLPANRNHGYKWILCVIDVFSKKAWARPTKTKAANEVTEAFYDIIKEEGTVATQLDTDNDKAFLGRPFQELIDAFGIYHNVNIPGDHRAQGVVEQFNKILKRLLYKYMEAYETNDWVDALQDLTYNYNHSFNSAIQGEPTNYSKVKVRAIRRKRLEKAHVRRFEVGDRVRLRNPRNVFSKGYEAQWSKMIYTVERRQGSKYFLVGKPEPVKGENLQPIDPHMVQHINPYLAHEEERRSHRRSQRISRRIRQEGVEQAREAENLLNPSIARRAAVDIERRARRPPERGFLLER